MVRRYFQMKQYCRIFPLKKLWAQNVDFKFLQGHINFSRVNDPAEVISAESMPRWNHFNRVNDPAEISREIFELFHNFVRKIMVVSAGWGWLMKKTEGRKPVQVSF
jgi:hypothetical protein